MTVTNPIFYFLVLGTLFTAIAPLLLRWTPRDWVENSGRNKNLEGLRGFLAPSVFIHHSLITYFFYLKKGVWELTPSTFYNNLGFCSITVFFFITGFLFWNQRLYQKSPWSGKKFFKKRALRLVPAFYIMVLALIGSVCILTHWQLNEPLTQITGQVLTWLTFGLPFGDFASINSYQPNGADKPR